MSFRARGRGRSQSSYTRGRGRGSFRGQDNLTIKFQPRHGRRAVYNNSTYADRYLPIYITKKIDRSDIEETPTSPEKRNSVPGPIRRTTNKAPNSREVEAKTIISTPKIAYTVRVELDGEMDIVGVFLDYSKALASAETVMSNHEDDSLEWNSRGSDYWSLNGNSVSIQTWQLE